MSWNDRIRQAAYTSPSGVRLTFTYEDVRKVSLKKTAGFEFPDVEGTFVQDLGRSGRQYPLRLFFHGENYDLETDAFEAALLERGTGKLEHPIYGVVDVVPFGRITRRDDLKTAANQAVLEVVFWETIGLIYPAVQTDPASAVLEGVLGYNNALGEGFSALIDLDTAVERVTFRNTYLALLDTVSDALSTIAGAQEDVGAQFSAITDSITQGIDVLIAQPATLAFQTALMIQSPARALTAIGARLDAYGGLVTSIITGDGAVLSPGNDSRNSNKFHTNDLYASTYITGAVISVVNNQFTIKSEALLAADVLLTSLAEVTTWRDDNFESLEQIDTGEAYQKLLETVSLAAGFLVEISFSLEQERSIILDRSRSLVDLTAELYGIVDDKLDFLISSNNLSGSEILELPAGREIVYYT